MLNLNKVTYNLFYLMLFFPLLSYVSFGIMGKGVITAYFIYIFFLYGVAFIVIKWKYLKFPPMLYLLVLYSILLSIWEIRNGGLETRGLVQILLNKPVISIVFIIVIIYNTNFSKYFIERSILIIKITVILATIVSLIQTVDYSFLDANSLWAQGRAGDTLTGNIYEDRRSSIFGYVNQNEIGLSYMPLLSVLIGVLLARRNKYSYLFLTLGGVTALLSNGRYIIVAFVLITLQIAISRKLKISGIIKYLFAGSITALVMLQVLSLIGYDFVDWYNLRLFHEGSIQETTRFKAIDNFVMFFNRNPMFGTGVFITQEIREASRSVGSSQIHVGYLAHLVSYGLVGSLFLFGFWFLLAKKLFKSARNTNYWGSFIAFAIFLWANVTLVHYSIFFYGIFFALIFDKYYSDNAKNYEMGYNGS